MRRCSEGCKFDVLGAYLVADTAAFASHMRIQFSGAFECSSSAWSSLKGLADAYFEGMLLTRFEGASMKPKGPCECGYVHTVCLCRLRELIRPQAHATCKVAMRRHNSLEYLQVCAYFISLNVLPTVTNVLYKLASCVRQSTLLQVLTQYDQRTHW